MKPVFIHISKNAGTSVNAAAGGYIMNAGHRTAASWVAEHGTDRPLFAIVRDPYRRVISEYSYRRRRFDRGEQNPHLTNLVKPFDEWALSTYQGDEFRTRGFFERTGAPFNEFNMIGDRLIWFIPQAEWLTDSNGELLVDDVLRFETLADDWRRLSEKYGFSCDLGHRNQSPAPSDLADRLTKPVRDVITDYFDKDFDLFGYEPVSYTHLTLPTKRIV